MTAKRITKAEVLKAESDVTQIRMALDGEAELLAQHYSPRLIAYCALTTSMKMAEKAGLGPVQYAKLAADTINLFSRAQGGYPVAISFVGLSDPDDK